MTRTARIIIVENCEECPHLSIEETKEKEYTFCWDIMQRVNDIYKIDKSCPLEEIDVEFEDETPND